MSRPWSDAPRRRSPRLSVRTVKSIRQVVASLSGGQRQTVAIARAVIWNSKFVILDEPTAALGVAQTEQVLRLVRQLADNGLAVVLISHNLNEVFRVADRISVLYLGKMAAQVKAAEVNNNDVVELITGGRSERAGGADDAERPGDVMTRGGRRPQETDAGTPPEGRPDRRAQRLPGAGTWRRRRLSAGGARPARARDGVYDPASADVHQLVQLRQSHPSGAAVIVIAMGLVFVLLLGEIDLSAGFTAGTAAAVMGVASPNGTGRGGCAILACLATGAFIGTIIGLLVARLGIPSFVVTLAAFLALQGVLLKLIGEGGTVAVRDDTLLAINNDDMPVWLGWALYVVVVVGSYAVLALRRAAARRASGLAARRRPR